MDDGFCIQRMSVEALATLVSHACPTVQATGTYSSVSPDTEGKYEIEIRSF